MKFRIYVVLSILLISIGCQDRINIISERKYLMGTLIEIKIQSDDIVNSKEAIKLAFNEIERIYEMFDRYNETSYISKINNRQTTKLNKELKYILDSSNYVSRVSSGAFDPTVLPLLNLWNEYLAKSNIPPIDEINRAKKLVDYKNIILNKDKIILKNKVHLDLGAIVKGYAVDRAVNILRENNIKNALINAGGDIFVLGLKNKNKWRVGIKHPRDRNKILRMLEIQDKAVVTSGDYERFQIVNGTRYSHIINPHTGFQESDIVSITVITDSCMYADAFATAMFVLGRDASLDLALKLKDVDIIIVDKNLKIFESKQTM